jgi:hypothetical protein
VRQTSAPCLRSEQTPYWVRRSQAHRALPRGELALINGQALGKGFVPLSGGATAVYNSSGLAYYRHADWPGSTCGRLALIWFRLNTRNSFKSKRHP